MVAAVRAFGPAGRDAQGVDQVSPEVARCTSTARILAREPLAGAKSSVPWSSSSMVLRLCARKGAGDKTSLAPKITWRINHNFLALARTPPGGAERPAWWMRADALGGHGRAEREGVEGCVASQPARRS